MTGHITHMEYVKRKANSKVKVVADNFEEHMVNFLCEINRIVTMEEGNSVITDSELGSYWPQICSCIIIDTTF